MLLTLDEPLMLTFSERALELLRRYMDESDGELTALRISSGDASPESPTWELSLVADDEWKATDVEIESDGLTVLVERDVADLLQGATVDYVKRGGQAGFQIDTVPKRAEPVDSVPTATDAVAAGPVSDDDAPAGSPAAEDRDIPFESEARAPAPTVEERITIPNPPQGPMADRIREILDAKINPAVSMHGGHIGLADVKDGEIYIVMSGGCQGCALSRMTLKQGVERMIRQELPDVKAVHDVTDHAEGDNPYYEAPIG